MVRCPVLICRVKIGDLTVRLEVRVVVERRCFECVDVPFLSPGDLCEQCVARQGVIEGAEGLDGRSRTQIDRKPNDV
jgi:hypothetical protein